MICGHEWSPTVSNLLQGKGCPKCAKSYRRTHEEFIDEMKKINSNIKICGHFEKTTKMQRFITVGGFLLNVIFGLPSIYSALGILRDFCSFIQGDVPIISQANVSVIIWLLLNVWMYWKIFINRKKL